MIAKKGVSLLFIILLLAVFTWYATHSVDKVMPNISLNMVEEDTTIEGLVVRQYDDKGRLITFLETPLVKHIPQRNQHWLQTPHIILAQAKEGAWEIDAQQALSMEGGAKIILRNNVQVLQKKAEDGSESLLKTEKLIYFPKERTAMTNAEVTYQQPGSIVQSKGIEIDLAEKRVKLLHHARGTYEPKRG